MDIEKYIMEYVNMVSKDLSDKVMRANLDYQTSTYSNKTGKIDNSDERVNMDEFWIRNTHELYEPLKKCFVNAINMYMTDHHISLFNISQTFVSIGIQKVGSCPNTTTASTTVTDNTMDTHMQQFCYT